MSRALAPAVMVALVVCVAAGASAQIGGAAAGSLRLSTVSALRPLPAASAATAWCGTAAQQDRVPNGVAGNPVHWIYFIPSDGSDDLGSVAASMQSDAAEIDTWWRGQDPTRAPRNDVTTFSCGTQLDITTVRSTRSGAQLAPIAARFTGIVDTLEQAGFTSSFTKYLVYYDGPVDDDNICGQGGSERSDGTGFGVAIVYFDACAGVSTAAVAAHEFLHTVGAVPSAAPNDCPGEDSGHTCDDKADIMYPAIGGEALAAKVLDPGRNDYYGHPSAWLDTQDSSWLVRLDSQAQLALSVSGSGTVAADVPGLLCSTGCATTWNTGQPLVLTASPGPGRRFVRWGGLCSGEGACSLSVTAGARVSALFAPTTFPLKVSVAGRGGVRSSKPGITCPLRCTAGFLSYSPVQLVATPAKGWRLRAWSGACRGAKRTCTVPMSAATQVRATFARP